MSWRKIWSLNHCNCCHYHWHCHSQSASLECDALSVCPLLEWEVFLVLLAAKVLLLQLHSLQRLALLRPGD